MWNKPRFRRPPHMRRTAPESVAKKLFDAIEAIELAKEFEMQLEDYVKDKMEKEKKEKEKDEKKTFWGKKFTTSQIFIFMTLIQPFEMIGAWILWKAFFN